LTAAASLSCGHPEPERARFAMAAPAAPDAGGRDNRDVVTP